MVAIGIKTTTKMETGQRALGAGTEGMSELNVTAEEENIDA
jgi:hypothetical protein